MRFGHVLDMRSWQAGASRKDDEVAGHNLPVMAITERTRKILWIKAGGRCSVCRIQLVTEGTDTDEPSVFGQEAHMVARARNGPRAGEVADVDSYDNLILLCGKDHKRVHDQVGHYTVDRLKQIKQK